MDTLNPYGGNTRRQVKRLHAEDGQWVPKDGRYVQVGIFGRPVRVPLDLVLYRELTMNSGNASTPQSWHRALQLLEAGLVDLDVLVTDIVPLDEWERAFAATQAGVGMKIVLDPRMGGGRGKDRP